MKARRLIETWGVGVLSAAACFAAHATVVDVAPLSVTTLGTATFTQTNVKATGTGRINTFVEVKSGAGGTNPRPEAFNTTGNGFENGNSATFNRAITVGEVGVTDTNGALPGGLALRFLLDINQDLGKGPNGSAADNMLSLDEVQVFVSTAPNQSAGGLLVRPPNGTLLALASSKLVYQMDAGGDNRLDLHANFGSGSGSGDLFMDIPLNLFTAQLALLGLTTPAQQDGGFIYLYSRFGSVYPNTGGFEEWAAIKGTAIEELPCDPRTTNCGGQQLPEPGNLSLFAIGLAGAAAAARWRRRKS